MKTLYKKDLNLAPKITLLPSGINGGIASTGNSAPPLRGQIQGWSAGAARRNMRFLQSVMLDKLPPMGLSITLTVKDCPASSKEWSRLTKGLVEFLLRHGATQLHWVTEWQRRGVPHLHGVAYFEAMPDPFIQTKVIAYWLHATSHLGTLGRGQHVVPIEGSSGWFQYMSKHASRGHGHYQREKGTLPRSWQTTGQLWGKRGNWPVDEVQVELTKRSWFLFRRVIKSYVIADARSQVLKAKRFGDAWSVRTATRRLVYARGMLRNNKRGMSEVRGLNEWLPWELSQLILDNVWQRDTQGP